MDKALLRYWQKLDESKKKKLDQHPNFKKYWEGSISQSVANKAKEEKKEVKEGVHPGFNTSHVDFHDEAANWHEDQAAKHLKLFNKETDRVRKAYHQNMIAKHNSYVKHHEKKAES